jgi:hypothetical protein
MDQLDRLWRETVSAYRIGQVCFRDLFLLGVLFACDRSLPVLVLRSPPVIAVLLSSQPIDVAMSVCLFVV